MSVVSFKVKREVKERMEKLKGKVNWAEELRGFVVKRIRELEARERMEMVIRELEEVPAHAPQGFSRASVREDRDSG